MSEAEVTLNYRELPVACLHWTLLGIVPILALFVLLCSASAIALPTAQLGNISLFIFSLFVLSGLAIGGLLVTADKTIFISRDGISLPFLVCPRLKLRSEHAWSDLVDVKLLSGGQRGVLMLKFKDRSRAKLKLDLLPAENVENLFVSMDVWSGGADMFPALLEARLKLSENAGNLDAPGYTELWEEELTRRFGPTNFIPLEAGQSVHELVIERQLAFGGMSAIYLVSDKSKRQFVLKEAVVPGDTETEMRISAETMLDREAQILASLSHPRIASVLDHFLEAGRHYILMELIDGEDLRRLVNEHGKQSEQDVIYWSMQLLEILQYLHSQTPPVVHRDLSPDNLMLRENGDICLIDFGAANHFMGTATGTLIGKQAYIAPEQLRGKAEPRSDIYAFGCTVFFLLTGKDPEPLAVSSPRSLNNAVSVALDNIVTVCTAQEEGGRPADAQAISDLFKQLAPAVSHG